MASSSNVVLPMATAFAALNFSTTVASKTGTYPLRILLLPVVGTSLVEKLSLITNGIPQRGLFSSGSVKEAAKSRASFSIMYSNALLESFLAKAKAS